MHTREFKAEIILSDVTFAEVHDYVEADDLGEVAIRGRTVPTRAYSVKRLRSPQQGE